MILETDNFKKSIINVKNHARRALINLNKNIKYSLITEIYRITVITDDFLI